MRRVRQHLSNCWIIERGQWGVSLNAPMEESSIDHSQKISRLEETPRQCTLIEDPLMSIMDLTCLASGSTVPRAQKCLFKQSFCTNSSPPEWIFAQSPLAAPCFPPSIFRILSRHCSIFAFSANSFASCV